jgi:magnesium transporter
MPESLEQPPLQDVVTRHMRRDFVRVPSDLTVGQAIEYVRGHPSEGRILYFYVLDDDQKLRGVVPTRRLLFSPADRPVTEIMVSKVIAIPAAATVLEACEFFTLHQLLAFPVIDDAGRMLGIVDVELYTGELSDLDASQRASDLFQLIGVHLTETQQASPLTAFRKRFVWLLCNIGGGILAAFLAWLYEPVLEHVVAMSLFIPVVLALAESVSIQSLSLALNTLHVHRPTWSALGKRASRELLVGLLLGAASGLLVALVALVWLQQPRVAWCIFGGILGGVAGAALFGLIMPYLLRLLQRDPRVAAGPIALACADMLTLLLYFNLGYWLLL